MAFCRNFLRPCLIDGSLGFSVWGLGLAERVARPRRINFDKFYAMFLCFMKSTLVRQGSRGPCRTCVTKPRNSISIAQGLTVCQTHSFRFSKTKEKKREARSVSASVVWVALVWFSLEARSVSASAASILSPLSLSLNTETSMPKPQYLNLPPPQTEMRSRSHLIKESKQQFWV